MLLGTKVANIASSSIVTGKEELALKMIGWPGKSNEIVGDPICWESHILSRFLKSFKLTVRVVFSWGKTALVKSSIANSEIISCFPEAFLPSWYLNYMKKWK